MRLIKTKSFELAAYTRGDASSDKLAIVMPGRLDTKDYANFISHAEYLANRGFFALAFDPPGTWESPGGIGIYTTTNYIKAVNELIEHFGNKATLLLGHSRGGTVAILAGSSNAAVVGFIVIMANYGSPSSPGPEAIESGVEVTYRDLPPGISKTSDKKKFALPISYFEDGKRYDPVAVLKKCRKPKLLIYGIQDEFTKPEKVKEVYGLIPEPKMIHELNSKHDYRHYPEIFAEVNEAIGRFLDNYFSQR